MGVVVVRLDQILCPNQQSWCSGSRVELSTLQNLVLLLSMALDHSNLSPTFPLEQVDLPQQELGPRLGLLLSIDAGWQRWTPPTTTRKRKASYDH